MQKVKQRNQKDRNPTKLGYEHGVTFMDNVMERTHGMKQ
jgi:hypothetical protein